MATARPSAGVWLSPQSGASREPALAPPVFAMARPIPSLYLITPRLDDAEAVLPRLEAACSAASPEAVLLRLAASDERTLVNRVKRLAAAVQAHGAAAIVADPGPAVDLAALVTRGGADGAHADDPSRIEELCQRLKDGRDVGAGGLRTKHDAMAAGERGVDYVMFGEPGPDGLLPPLELVEERAAWWAEIFQTPCVVFAPTLASVARLAATGAEFVAVCDAVWDDPSGPAEAAARARHDLAGEEVA